MSFLAIAAAVALVSSCNNDQKSEIKNIQEEENVAIAFEQYTTTPTTRATTLDLDSIKSLGFGVFAFSQDQMDIKEYSKSNFMPNFMYNQKVTNDGTDWTYAPVKYWPNNKDAKLSFYAYAPYMEAFNADLNTITPETNTYLQVIEPTAKEGLRLMLGYDYNGPGIEYNLPQDPTKGIDLMWGEYATTAGYAPVNLSKPSVTEKIKFNFKHALSRVDFNVQVWADAVRGGTNQPLESNTTITIKSVSLIGSIAKRGTLRLYDGSWNIDKEDFGNIEFDSNDFTDLINGGINDNEAIAPIALLKYLESNDLPKKDNYVTLIPSQQKFQIKIVYDVTTVDSTNPKNSSTVTNTIVSAQQYDLKQGYAYHFTLHIGMTSVKFEAQETPWETTGGDIDVDLPANN